MKPIKPTTKIPMAEAFATILNSRPDGFFVIVHTLLHFIKKSFKDINKDIIKKKNLTF